MKFFMGDRENLGSEILIIIDVLKAMPCCLYYMKNLKLQLSIFINSCTRPTQLYCLGWVGQIPNLNPKQKMGNRLQHVNLYTPSAQSLWVLGLSFFQRT